MNLKAYTENSKIYNCDKNTIEYYHELGHINYKNTIIGSISSLIQKYLILITIFLLCFELNYFGLGLMTMYIILDFIEECYCDKYARTSFRQK